MGDLRSNETKITAENTFSQDHLWMEGNHESKKLRQHFLLVIFAESWVVP